MRIFRSLAATILLSIPAAAIQSYTLGPSISTTTGRATQSLAGSYNLSASSQTISTPTITLNGANGGINASSFTAIYGVIAATGTFTSLTASAITVPTMLSSETIKGGGGLGVTYGINAATGVITGNSFSVGTSTLVISGGLIGILTSSPATSLDVNGNVQFGSGATKSTFSATGGLTLASVSSITFTGGSGIRWADGTISTSAFTTPASTVSTYTWLVTDLRISNTIGTAYAGSTITWTSVGARTRFILNGGAIAAPNSNIACTFCLDSNCTVGRYSLALPMLYYTNAENSSSAVGVSIYAETTAVTAAGSHSAFLTCNSSATNGIQCNLSPCFLKAEDIR